MTDSNWAQLENHKAPALLSLFESDAERVAKLTVELAGIYFDLSKTHLDDALLSEFSAMAENVQLGAAKEALFSGAIVNPTEGRAAEHTAERGTGNPDAVAHAR